MRAFARAHAILRPGPLVLAVSGGTDSIALCLILAELRDEFGLVLHVAHFVIDGGIRSDARPMPANNPDSMLEPDAIAETYWAVLQQHRSAWSWEIEVRPWVEKF